MIRIELSEGVTKAVRQGKAARVMSKGVRYHIVPFKRRHSVEYLRRRVAYLEGKLKKSGAK